MSRILYVIWHNHLFQFPLYILARRLLKVWKPSYDDIRDPYVTLFWWFFSPIALIGRLSWDVYICLVLFTTTRKNISPTTHSFECGVHVLWLLNTLLWHFPSYGCMLILLVRCAYNNSGDQVSRSRKCEV